MSNTPQSPTDSLGITQRLEGGFAALGERFYTRLPAQPIPSPYLVAVSADALRDLGLPSDSLDDPAAILRLAGHPPGLDTRDSGAAALDRAALPWPAEIPHAQLPLASVYSGHQFGQWAGQLGDGRALTIGEIADPAGVWQEVQLKGSGLTPYSRMGDGRAVLRSSIREFLCSEAMHALGIPTTRALALTGSAMPVRRESIETAAIVTRFAPSFVRFGHFEHFWSIDDFDALRRLADHVIAHHYPELEGSDNPYFGLLECVATRTAEMIAQWQSVGFCHGVMNTDNMSILGLTIDYGPFGFLDGFDPRHICNHTDSQGRYAYHRQPEIGRWNLFALAQALLPLIATPQAGTSMPESGTPAADAAIALTKSALTPYGSVFSTHYQARMAAKIGLQQPTAEDGALIDRLLQLMDGSRADFTLSFRGLANVRQQEGAPDSDPLADSAAPTKTTPSFRDAFLDLPAVDAWLSDYRARLRQQGMDDASRAAQMRRVNPKYVLRNHLAETAIRAARDGDFSETQRLASVLRKPFDEQEAYADYAAPPPDWAAGLEVSCSS
ncbi:protein adenylyltransferase SelO [Robbsia sp. KACC 23696]|uniref:protein adenylyltransferase SelO n=1 Tax=Robbsia sp. KACC 23696 TaxID=3149231 RepID=UPI00325C1CCD